MLPSNRPLLSSIRMTSEPYPPPPAAVLIPPVTMRAEAHSTIVNMVASIRSFVRNVRGRKAAKTSAFQTQFHLSSAATGSTATDVV